MRKPQPKEITITHVGISILWIYTSSEDAYRWIEREAPTFGRLHAPDEYSQHWMLDVKRTFSVDEVYKYLLSYGT